MQKLLKIHLLDSGLKIEVPGDDKKLMDYFDGYTTAKGVRLVNEGKDLLEVAWIATELNAQFKAALEAFNADPVREYVMSVFFQIHAAIESGE